MELYSPIGDNPMDYEVPLYIDVLMSCAVFLIGASPMLALIGFVVTR